MVTFLYVRMWGITVCGLASFHQGSLILVCKVVPSCLAALAESPPKVEGVSIDKLPASIQGLDVTWSAVRGSNITYTVCYSVEEGTNNAPPTNQSDCISGNTRQYARLYPLSKGTTYYIWVRAESSGGQGPFSNRTMETTYKGTVFVAVYRYFTHVKCKIGRV